MSASAPASAGASGRTRTVPNRNTVGVLGLIAAMWYAGASQNNGAAYLLAFILSSVGLVSILHTSANLRGLRFFSGPVAPVFSGEIQRIPVSVLAAPGRTHLAVRLRTEVAGESGDFPEISGPLRLRTDLWIATPQRGRFEEVTLVATSLFPLGFFTARMKVALRQERWIYPALEGSRPLPATPAGAHQRGVGTRLEGDDFAGLRSYLPGEPQRHIDWKAVARGQELVIKQWAGENDATLALSWADTAGLAHEARLSQLATWVAMAARSGRGYSLSLPGWKLAAASGDAHFHECLRALAAYPREEAAA